ncbi:MAG: hypothetical protein UW03_C0015G0039 [Candidatus Peregrinibacteria bacterium GW2011_GWA2_43_8]|nr:MAG: hypothetical protein UW03_C0015G0039 [Candidatus Peregrinibacteria bacterium GW2011_GWA2_43_8]
MKRVLFICGDLNPLDLGGAEVFRFIPFNISRLEIFTVCFMRERL